MTRNAQRLRRLLDLRKRQEEQARVQLAQSLKKASEISDEVKARTEALERALEGSPEPRVRSHLETLMVMAEPAIRAAQAAEVSAMGAAQEVRREWNKAAQRLKGMERLEDRRVEEQAERQAHQEKAQLDDSASNRAGDRE
jgi:flagellar export protein FliJ